MAPPEAAGGGEHRDFTGELDGLSGRIKEAEGYLDIDTRRRRRGQLEVEAARPDLWDDPDRARAVTTELGRVADDLDRFEELTTSLEDARVLDELVDEAQSSGSPDEGLTKELEQVIDDLERRVARLELESLLSGEYDDRDAVAEVHAGAGGTDAQDWTEMLLRKSRRHIQGGRNPKQFRASPRGHQVKRRSITPLSVRG